MHCPNCRAELREGSMFCHQCGILLETLLEFEEAKEKNNLATNPSVTTWPENPWIEIWTKPKVTIRAIINTFPEQYIIPLAILSGIAQALDEASANNMGDDLSIGTIMLFAIVIGAIVGLLTMYIGSAITNWIGNKLGGTADVIETRSAVAWAGIPIVFGLVLWLPQLALYGSDMFTSYAPRITQNPIPLLIVGIIEIIKNVWAFGLLIACLSEVQRFSEWKAFVTLLIPGIVIFVSFFLCLTLSNL